MKLRIWSVCMALGLLGLGGTAQASLAPYTVNGVNLVYDTDRDLTWVANANLFKTQSDADPITAQQIITAVGSVAGHNLVLGDFDTANGRMNWWGAMAWAQWLDYGGVSDWRLWSALNSDGSGPCGGFNCTGSELGHLFYTEGGLTAGQAINSSTILSGLFTNMQDSIYWSGSQYAPYPNLAWNFPPATGARATTVRTTRTTVGQCAPDKSPPPRCLRRASWWHWA